MQSMAVIELHTPNSNNSVGKISDALWKLPQPDCDGFNV